MEQDGQLEEVNENNQWKWNKGGDYNVIWEPFDKKSSQVIEACYKRGSKTIVMLSGPKPWNNMSQYYIEIERRC